MVVGRHSILTCDPTVEFPVGHAHQGFHFRQGGLIKVGDDGVREPTEQQIHLPCATMPGVEQQALAPRIKVGG